MKTPSTTSAALFALAALMVVIGTRPASGAQDVVAEASPVEILAGVKASAATSTLSLSASVTTGLAPATVTLVTTVGGTALTGDIVFKSGTVTLAVAAINKSTSTATVKLPASIHSLTAVYVRATGDLVSPPITVVVDNPLVCP